MSPPDLSTEASPDIEPNSHRPLFEVRGLVKSYGPKTILRGIDFDIGRGECFVILGGSGTGKSVTLRQLNGLERPDEGTVTFDGQVLGDLTEEELYPVRRRVAMLFQSGALFDSMNVLDNVAFPLREHTDLPEDEIRDQVARRLAMVNLEGIEEKMPSDLSGGMRKRVALARSLMSEPEVLLFDEPTTGLDPRTSATIGSLILAVQRDLGVTPVVVTHDLALTDTIADRIAFLHEGKLRFLGTWDEAKQTDDPMIRDFLAGKEETEHAA